MTHPIIEGELGRQRREGFDREVARAALVSEARAHRDARKAEAAAKAPEAVAASAVTRVPADASSHPFWAHLIAVLTHPHVPHHRAH